MALVTPTTQDHRNQMMAAIEGLLKGLQLDLDDPNLSDTPRRVARAFEELCEAHLYPDRIDAIFKVSFPSQNYTGMITIPDIPAIGLCPHHLLPVEYLISFGYLPSANGGVIGLSKIPRFVQFLCHQPVLQEDLTNQIVDEFVKRVKPSGVGVVVHGEHSCVRVRGVKTPVPTITSTLRGVLLEDAAARAEFLQLLSEGHSHHNRR